jgi:RND family efflux transporter MFP subunit
MAVARINGQFQNSGRNFHNSKSSGSFGNATNRARAAAAPGTRVAPRAKAAFARDVLDRVDCERRRCGRYQRAAAIPRCHSTKTARAPGRIEILNVEEGSRVKKGQVLAALEHADLDAALAANQAELERTRAQVAEQEVEIARTKREYDRALKVLQSRAITETEFDVAKFAHEAAVARIESLKAAVSLAEARVREAEQLKENMFVRAPFDGTVISKDAEVGESILPGGLGEGSGRGSVVTIADLERLEVDCDVKEDYISRVMADRPAEIAVDAVPDRRYKGKVRKVIPMGDRARATIKVKVAILDADERLFPEMSGTVYFLPEAGEAPAEAAARRVFCPTDSVVSRADESHVWIIEDERVRQVEVKTGSANDGRTEILAGLSGAEQVVVKPPGDLYNGQLVKIAQ